MLTRCSRCDWVIPQEVADVNGGQCVPCWRWTCTHRTTAVVMIERESAS